MQWSDQWLFPCLRRSPPVSDQGLTRDRRLAARTRAEAKVTSARIVRFESRLRVLRRWQSQRVASILWPRFALIQTRQASVDVVVAGAGVAGLTAALRLARAGFRVQCVEPHRFPRWRVGESLDWSTPALLWELGIDPDALIAHGVGTTKREVYGFIATGPHLEARLPAWLGRWPLRFEHVTLHVDRIPFDQLLFETAAEAGVGFVWDRVARVEMDGDTFASVVTSSGDRHPAAWFIDASGRSRVLARAAHIGNRSWGAERMALWSHWDAPMQVEGTALHFDDTGPDLVWAWEIPIKPERVSVGVVVPLAEFKELRIRAATLDEVFVGLCTRFPDLRVGDTSGAVRARTYRARVSDRVARCNWFMVGEAAALIDPLSSIGVTAAMRHAIEAADVIIRHRNTPGRATRHLARYDRRLRSVGGLYNDALDNLLYGPHVRTRFGMRQAARAYVILGFATNALYARLQPAESGGGAAVMGLVLALFRVWTRAWQWAAVANPISHLSVVRATRQACSATSVRLRRSGR